MMKRAGQMKRDTEVFLDKVYSSWLERRDRTPGVEYGDSSD